MNALRWAAGKARSLAGSVRVRVTVTAVIAVGCALAVAVGIIEVSLAKERQHVLMTTAEEQARVVQLLNPSLTPPFQLPASPTVESGLVQVLHFGKVVAASKPLRSDSPLWLPGDPTVQTNGYVLAGQATDVHVVSIPVSFGKTTDYVVVVTSLDQFDKSLLYTQRLIEIGMPTLLLLVGLIAWLIAGRALRPIEALRSEVAEVAAVAGAHRVPEPATDDEVGRLARTLNSMLDRLESATKRERRFVADASHELRSPIANIRTVLEVALHHPDRAEWTKVATEVLAQDERMGGLVESLLFLARSDDGGLAAESVATPSDVSVVAETVVSAASADSAREGGPEVTLRSTPVFACVPAIYLERMLSNLVENARRYAETTVEVIVRSDGSSAVLEVRDDGPGVPVHERQRIFERFVRLDEARDRLQGGFGLGLAIVADLCKAFGGTIEIRHPEPDRPGAVFVMSFPLAPATAPVPEPRLGHVSAV